MSKQSSTDQIKDLRPAPRLAVDPLLEAIGHAGGLAAVVGRSLELEEDVVKATPQYNRVRTALKDGGRRGGFTVYWLDDFIVTYLRKHPSEVYGDDWFEAGEELVETDAA